jgi:polysaccharide export outer membrane protein
MRRIISLLALVLAALALPRGARAQAEPTYLQPGDQIHLVVFRQPEFTGDFMVSAEGTIQHPLLADVSVVDASRSVIRERLRAALARYERDPSFVFDFLYRVAVWGEVRQPNLLRLPPQTTIAEAIAAAGGATENAALNRVFLRREGRETQVDLQGGADGAGMRIRSGDQIRVPRRANVLRDYVGPFASMVGAVAAVAAVLRIK